MAMSFDSILNFAIPAAVIIFFIVIIFDKIKEPAGRFFSWLGSLFSSGAESLSENTTNLRDAPLNFG